MTAAIDLLRNFDIDSVLEAVADCSGKGVEFHADQFWEERSRLPARTTAGTRSPHVTASPIQVTVSGLRCGLEGLEAATRYLDIEAYDYTHRLGALYQVFKCAYRSIHLYNDKTPRGSSNPKAGFEKFKNSASSKFRIRFVDTMLCLDRERQRQSHERPPLPQFDARELITQCEDRVWIDEIRLDRLSICEMGLTRRVQGGIDSPDELFEVFSSPLP